MRTVRKRLEGKWGEVPRQECAPDQGLQPGQQERLQPEPWESLEAAQDGPLLEGHGWIAGDGGGHRVSADIPRGGQGAVAARTYSVLPAFLFSSWVADTVFPVFLLL